MEGKEVGAVYVAEAAPSAVTTVRLLREPALTLSTRVCASTGLLLASLTIMFIWLVLEPSAVRLVGVAVMVMLAGGPAINVIWVVALIPVLVAVMVAIPVVVGAVRVAFAIPLLSVIEGDDETVPAVAEKVTEAPWTGWPPVSRTTARNPVWPVPFAIKKLAPAVNVMAPVGPV